MAASNQPHQGAWQGASGTNKPHQGAWLGSLAAAAPTTAAPTTAAPTTAAPTTAAPTTAAPTTIREETISGILSDMTGAISRKATYKRTVSGQI